MRSLEKIEQVYLIGIGGIGMSALARYFKSKGMAVAGYDLTPTDLTKSLVESGIAVHYTDDVERIPLQFLDADKKDSTLVVYTPAVPKKHCEMTWFRENYYTLLKRSEVLGAITSNTFTIAVAGTHGKTTTSAILAHILKLSGFSNNAFLGGIATNYNTNMLLDENAKAALVEADEFDRSFLTLHPDIAVVTSVDTDHLDIYQTTDEVKASFNQFASQIKEGGKLIVRKGITPQTKARTITYGIDEEAQVIARNVRIDNGRYVFDLVTDTFHLYDLTLQLPGRHNVENALAAIAVAQQLGITEDQITEAINTFTGVKRRFEFHVKTDDMVYIDDYAHHPEELKACIQSARELYPGKKITGVFQPHLFSRTRDLADDFARSLGMLNELLLMEIYPARELPIEGITSGMLLDKVELEEKILVQKSEVIRELSKRRIEVLLTMGAGDIDQLVQPIKEELEDQMKKN